MKVQKILILASILMLTFGCNKQTDSATQQPESQNTPETKTVAQKKGVKSAVFIEDKEPIEGTIHFSQKNGKQYIEFQSDFKTKEGPDLFVLLHKQEVPSSYDQKDYVKLGNLKQINGKQTYEIPSGLKLKDFNSVVIWCKRFKVTFGHAVIVK